MRLSLGDTRLTELEVRLTTHTSSDGLHERHTITLEVRSVYTRQAYRASRTVEFGPYTDTYACAIAVRDLTTELWEEFGRWQGEQYGKLDSKVWR